TFTLGAITELAGVPFLNGEFFPHDWMQPSRAAWSCAARAEVDAMASAMASWAVFIRAGYPIGSFLVESPQQEREDVGEVFVVALARDAHQHGLADGTDGSRGLQPRGELAGLRQRDRRLVGRGGDEQRRINRSLLHLVQRR